MSIIVLEYVTESKRIKHNFWKNAKITQQKKKGKNF